MSKKIFRSILAVSTAVLLICVFCISLLLYNYFGEIIKDELKAEALLLSGHIEELEEYSNNTNRSSHRITLIDTDGSVIFDSNVDETLMENHGNRDEVVNAEKHGEAYSQRYSDTLETKTIYYAKELSDGKILRVAQEQSSVGMLLKGITGPVVLIFIVIVFLAMVISRLISSRLVKPINDMDLSDPETEEPYPELAPLIRKLRMQNMRIDMQIEELQLKQKEFKTITDNMSEGFIIIDDKAEILSYNNSAVKLLNKTNEEIPHTALELNRSKSFRTAIEEALNGNHIQLPLENGDRFYNIIANPVTVGEDISGAVIMIVDNTEKEQREKLRREFTSNVSHELKTPLTTIYGVSDMIAEGIVKPDDIKGFASNIKEESGRMIILIDDIIKLSKMDESQFAEETSDVDLMEIANDVVNRLSFKAGEKNIGVYMQGESAIIKSTPSLCSEIAYNLCENAIKYNKNEGSVIIRVFEEDQNAVFEVEDTGIGIPFECRERIFERFFRADKSRSQKIDGTGLGLSIVKHAVQQMNGTINVESVVNEGTKITVRIPIK